MTDQTSTKPSSNEPEFPVTFKIEFLKTKANWKVTFIVHGSKRPVEERFPTEADALAFAEDRMVWYRNQSEFQPDFQPGPGLYSQQGKWIARPMINGEKVYLGVFATYRDAIDAVRHKTAKDGFSCHRMRDGRWQVRQNNKPVLITTFEQALKECGFWSITEQ